MGIPRNAVTPTAAIGQEGAGVATMPPPFGDVPDKVNEKIEPSESVIANGCPPPKTVALLYELMSIQQKVCQSAGAVPADVAAPQVAACAAVAKQRVANAKSAPKKRKVFCKAELTTQPISLILNASV